MYNGQPLSSKTSSNLHTSPIGIVPYKNGGWRLIAIRSAPGSYSSNDFIGPYFCTIKYMLPLMTKFH